MGQVTIDDVLPGMVLKQDLQHDGNVLIAAGTEITDRHITICKSWGVASMEIEDEDSDVIMYEQIEDLPEDKRKEIELLIDVSFSQMELNTPLEKALHQLFVRRVLKNVS